MAEGWKYFGNLQFPISGKEVTLIWNDKTETDVVWQAGTIDWEAELYPVAWKYLDTISK